MTNLPDYLLAALSQVWADHEQITCGTAVSVDMAADRHLFGMTEGTARRDAFQWAANNGRMLLSLSPCTWTRMPRGIPFEHGKSDVAPHMTEEPWSQGEPLLLTDMLICRVTADTVPYLPTLVLDGRPRCRYCRAECTGGTGLGLYTCTDCADLGAKRRAAFATKEEAPA